MLGRCVAELGIVLASLPRRMSALEQLRLQREQVSSNLRTVRKALRQDGDRERKRRKKQTEHTPTWTGRLGDVQLCLCALSLLRWNIAEALTVLQHVRCPPNWGHLSMAEQTTVLEDLFLSRDLEMIEGWMHEHSPGNHQRLVMLWQTFAEKQVADWVREVNTTKGVAPSSLVVYQRYLESLRPAPLHVRTALMVWRSRNAKVCWALRWRRRWGGSMGTFRLGDVDPADILLHKAGREAPWRALSGVLWG